MQGGLFGRLKCGECYLWSIRHQKNLAFTADSLDSTSCHRQRIIRQSLCNHPACTAIRLAQQPRAEMAPKRCSPHPPECRLEPGSLSLTRERRLSRSATSSGLHLRCLNSVVRVFFHPCCPYLGH